MEGSPLDHSSKSIACAPASSGTSAVCQQVQTALEGIQIFDFFRIELNAELFLYCGRQTHRRYGIPGGQGGSARTYSFAVAQFGKNRPKTTNQPLLSIRHLCTLFHGIRAGSGG